MGVIIVTTAILIGYFLNLLVLCGRIPELTGKALQANSYAIFITMMAAIGVIYLAVN